MTGQVRIRQDVQIVHEDLAELFKLIKLKRIAILMLRRGKMLPWMKKL